MDLFKGICLFLKYLLSHYYVLQKRRGIVHHEPPKLLLRDWLLLQNHRAKIRKILFFSVDCVIQLGNCIFCYINFDNNCIKNTPTDSSEGGNLAASKIRNLECPSYEICLIDYGCGKFNRKIHIMEQYP